jgi:hypothetical protein
MSSDAPSLSLTVELAPGQKLALPSSVVDQVGPGRWLITISPQNAHEHLVRGHGAFLTSYAPEDEGLYDDAAG